MVRDCKKREWIKVVQTVVFGQISHPPTFELLSSKRAVKNPRTHGIECSRNLNIYTLDGQFGLRRNITKNGHMESSSTLEP